MATGCALAQPASSTLRGYVTATTDYVHRGLSQSDSGGALQLGIDYQHASGFFTGLYASTLDYARASVRDRLGRLAADYYAGYGRRSGDWFWSVALTRYTYPGASIEYDYDELSASATFRRKFSYSVALSRDLLSFGRTAIDQEAGLTWPLPWNVEFAAAVGTFRVNDVPGGGYSYWNAGASKVLPRLVIDVRYYDGGAAPLRLLGGGVEDQWVLSLSYGFDITGRRSAGSDSASAQPLD